MRTIRRCRHARTSMHVALHTLYRDVRTPMQACLVGTRMHVDMHARVGRQV